MTLETNERFAFGKNWLAYLDTIDGFDMKAAYDVLVDFLETDTLEGKTFLDVGSGSGLMSLEARLLGASVVSFDYDPESVACTRELKHRSSQRDDPEWRIEQGSALDRDYLATLGPFDVVYSWGVLHHTGDMYAALGNVAELVKPGGRLYISIYNDQGRWSKVWRRIKRAYVRGGRVRRWAIVTAVGAFWRSRSAAADLVRRAGGVPRPDRTPERGMDRRRDLIDWVGGYPFEVAKPEEIIDFCRQRGFTLDRLKTVGGDLGCNEYVFTSRSGA